ncbi:UNVERIFIED_CONTAM: hypothetical protein Sradi_3800200 [Sesamum radiatum]|uniref:UBN2 domain-containing protein n=1 Tax=Sesamum radiatum TaxID=300843 RepID=A0AAW2Q0A9_SESRA
MTEGSSVREHGIKMLSLVERLEDLQARLDNGTYIDVILQLLPPSYDPFVVNYNMNGLEKSINELINMLVQHEVTTKKSEGKGKGMWVPSKSRLMMSVYIVGKRAIRRVSAPSSSPVQVLERSRKLSRDEVVLKLCDGKTVAAEATGIVHLIFSDHVRIELKD